ncbi:hypothetical protein GCM10027415_15970 [Humibacter ginsengisoli]
MRSPTDARMVTISFDAFHNELTTTPGYVGLPFAQPIGANVSELPELGTPAPFSNA